MDWSPESLYTKAKVFAERAHDESIESALFGFWMSLTLEMLARAALAHIHPALLADPREPDNIQYAFGIIPKSVPKSIQAKTVFARCSVFVPGFTDKMSGHCLIMADRRNSELHTGTAAFEGIDNSKWLPSTYEVLEVLLNHMHRDFTDLMGDAYAEVAARILEDRRNTIKRDVQEKFAAARKYFATLGSESQAEASEKADPAMANWAKANQLRRRCTCPACGLPAGMSGETVGRSPVRINEADGTISREVRVLPNLLMCPSCRLELKGYQEMNEAGLGTIYTTEAEEDPIEFFGIIPEEHVDIDSLLRDYAADQYDEYQNE
jgi:hypothetical protein